MNAFEMEQYGNTTVILPQLANEFERCFIIKPEKGNDQKTKRKSRLTGGSKRHDFQTLNIKIWAETKVLTWTWYL